LPTLKAPGPGDGLPSPYKYLAQVGADASPASSTTPGDFGSPPRQDPFFGRFPDTELYLFLPMG
jgi:hypothetical protein